LLLPRCFFSLHSSYRFQHTQPSQRKPSLRENIYTFPNLLTVSRIAACPVLGWSILSDNYSAATCLLLYAGITDWLDGFMARKYDMTSVLGTILDPAADKALVSTLVVTLTMQGLLPCELSTAEIVNQSSLPGQCLWAQSYLVVIYYCPSLRCIFAILRFHIRKLFNVTGTSQSHLRKCVPPQSAKSTQHSNFY